MDGAEGVDGAVGADGDDGVEGAEGTDPPESGRASGESDGRRVGRGVVVELLGSSVSEPPVVGDEG